MFKSRSNPAHNSKISCKAFTNYFRIFIFLSEITQFIMIFILWSDIVKIKADLGNSNQSFKVLQQSMPQIGKYFLLSRKDLSCIVRKEIIEALGGNAEMMKNDTGEGEVYITYII